MMAGQDTDENRIARMLQEGKLTQQEANRLQDSLHAQQARDEALAQDQIEGTENRIAVERRNYNEWSRRYNTRTMKFPSNVIASVMGFEGKPYFQAETAALESLQDPFGRHPQ